MGQYKEKYQKIVNELVKKSFPELKNRKISIVEFPRFFAPHSFAERGINNYYIFINKNRRAATKSQLKAILAHELCHIVLYHKPRSFLADILHNFIKFSSFAFNTEFSRKIETIVDKEVIKRGYGKELLIRAKEWASIFSKNELKEIYSKGYLSPKEIKKYMGKR